MTQKCVCVWRGGGGGDQVCISVCVKIMLLLFTGYVMCISVCVKIMLAWLGVHMCISVCVKIVLDLSPI